MVDLTRRAALASAAVPLLLAPSARAAEASATAPLNITENPYGPSPRALAAMRAAAVTANHYPHAEEERLIAVIAATNGVKPEQVVISSGALELLALTTTFWARDGVVMAPDLTYDTHVKYAGRLGGRSIRPALTRAMQFDYAGMLASLTPQVKLVYLCNPNNPTGLLADRASLRDFCIKASRVAPVMVDEAFIDMTPTPEADSVIDLVRAGHDVTVVGTFSKSYALASMRIGYAIGQPDRILEIRKVLATSHNGPGLAAAAVSYRDRAFLSLANRAVEAGRQSLYRTCDRAKLGYLPSSAAYVWVNLGPDATAVLKRMEALGTPLRQFGDAYPAWARVAVREPAFMDAFARSLPKALAG